MRGPLVWGGEMRAFRTSTTASLYLARRLRTRRSSRGTLRRMARLWCPQCGERVLDAGTYTIGQHHARNQRSTCPQCHAELVRHPDLEDNTWTVDDPTPPPDEELGGSG